MDIITADKTPQELYWYACDVLKARWPEAEPYIAKDPRWSYYYSRDIIGGRWPEEEQYILKSPWFSYLYAQYIIGGRWPEAEEVIMNSLHAKSYSRFVLDDDKISTHERTLFQLKYSDYIL